MGFLREAPSHDVQRLPGAVEHQRRYGAEAAHYPARLRGRRATAVLVHAAVLAMMQTVFDSPVSASQSQNTLGAIFVHRETADVEDLFKRLPDGLSPPDQTTLPFDPADHMRVRPTGSPRKQRHHLQRASLEAAMSLLHRLGAESVFSSSIEVLVQTPAKIGGVVLDANEKIGSFVDDALKGFLDGVKSVESHHALRHVGHFGDQVLGRSDFLSLGVGEDLIEKRGAP